jgi:hypothetical protein
VNGSCCEVASGRVAVGAGGCSNSSPNTDDDGLGLGVRAAGATDAGATICVGSTPLGGVVVGVGVGAGVVGLGEDVGQAVPPIQLAIVFVAKA